MSDTPVVEFESESAVAEHYAARADEAPEPISPTGEGEGGADPSAAPADAEPEAAVAAPSGEAAAPPPLNLEDPHVALELERLADSRVEARLQQLIQEAESYQSQQQPLQYEGQLPPPPDPFESDNFPAEMAAWQAQRDEMLTDRILAAQQQMLAPILNREREAEYAEASERVKDMLTDLTSRHGELGVDGAEDFVRDLAEAALPNLRQRYGGGPRVAELALEQAYKRAQQILSAAGTSAVERYRNQSEKITSAPTDLAVGSAGAQGRGGEESELDVARRYGVTI